MSWALGSVINASGAANRAFGNLDIDGLDAARKYSTGRAYCNAKLANILFTTELRHRYSGAGITTAAFRPGGSLKSSPPNPPAQCASHPSQS